LCYLHLQNSYFCPTFLHIFLLNSYFSLNSSPTFVLLFYTRMPESLTMACIRKTTVFCVLFFVLYVVFSYVEANECSSHFDCSGWRQCMSVQLHWSSVLYLQ
jgi:hypothetical protein